MCLWKGEKRVTQRIKKEKILTSNHFDSSKKNQSRSVRSQPLWRFVWIHFQTNETSMNNNRTSKGYEVVSLHFINRKSRNTNILSIGISHAPKAIRTRRNRNSNLNNSKTERLTRLCFCVLWSFQYTYIWSVASVLFIPGLWIQSIE